MQTREGPQSPVGRGRWGGALLQARFKPAIYAMTVDVGNHYATLPPIPFIPVRRCNNRYKCAYLVGRGGGGGDRNGRRVACPLC